MFPFYLVGLIAFIGGGVLALKEEKNRDKRKAARRNNFRRTGFVCALLLMIPLASTADTFYIYPDGSFTVHVKYRQQNSNPFYSPELNHSFYIVNHAKCMPVPDRTKDFKFVHKVNRKIASIYDVLNYLPESRRLALKTYIIYRQTNLNNTTEATLMLFDSWLETSVWDALEFMRQVEACANVLYLPIEELENIGKYDGKHLTFHYVEYLDRSIVHVETFDMNNPNFEGRINKGPDFNQSDPRAVLDLHMSMNLRIHARYLFCGLPWWAAQFDNEHIKTIGLHKFPMVTHPYITPAEHVINPPSLDREIWHHGRSVMAKASTHGPWISLTASMEVAIDYAKENNSNRVIIIDCFPDDEAPLSSVKRFNTRGRAESYIGSRLNHWPNTPSHEVDANKFVNYANKAAEAVVYMSISPLYIKQVLDEVDLVQISQLGYTRDDGTAIWE